MFDIPTQYCEQLLQIGWEPINTISNLAFIICGIHIYYILRDQNGVLKFFLPLLLFLVGIGSGWWHITHSHFGDIADSFSILVFASFITILYLQKLFQTWELTLINFFLLSTLVLWAEQTNYINGSLPYFVLFVGFIISSIFYTKKFPSSGLLIITAICTFGLAIIFRTIDPLICSAFPSGTHFLWHVLTAIFGYQLALLAVKK